MAKNRQDKPKEGRRCQGTNKNGGPCGASPLTPGSEIGGIKVSGKWCRQHDQDLPEAHKLTEIRRASGHKGGRPRKPTVPTVMRQLIEENLESFLAPYAKSVGLKVVPVNDGNDFALEPDPAAGAKLYGESKDGEIVMTNYDDLEAQQRAAERMFDRVYGRPKQATELSLGGSDEPVPEVPGDNDRALEVALILKQTGGITSTVNINNANGNNGGEE